MPAADGNVWLLDSDAVLHRLSAAGEWDSAVQLPPEALARTIAVDGGGRVYIATSDGLVSFAWPGAR